jgi:hypothetical protein
MESMHICKPAKHTFERSITPLEKPSRSSACLVLEQRLTFTIQAFVIPFRISGIKKQKILQRALIENH